MESSSTLNNLDGPFYQQDITPSPPESSIIGDYQTYITISNTNCSIVLTGSNMKDNSKKALKFVKRKEETFERLKNEIILLRISQNPRILKIDDYFPYKEYVCIVTPYTKYGSIYDYIVSHYPNGLPEQIASPMMKQMIESIQFLHGIGIVHRDVKPENFLIYEPNHENPKVVLSDFGFARMFKENDFMHEFLGTPMFSAPELIAKIPYGNSIDIWSLGISMFFLLSGKYPFPNFVVYHKVCKLRICKGQLNYQVLQKKNISSDAIDLIQKMCNVCPSKRISPSDALLHPWISSNHKQIDEEFSMGNALYSGNEYDFNVGI